MTKLDGGGARSLDRRWKGALCRWEVPDRGLAVSDWHKASLGYSGSRLNESSGQRWGC